MIPKYVALLNNRITRHSQRIALLVAMSAIQSFIVLAVPSSLSADQTRLISTRGGLHKKVIVASYGSTLHPAPADKEGIPVQAFSIYFKLWPSDDAKSKNEEQQGDWVCVGDQFGKPVGWLNNHADENIALIEWNTRFLLVPSLVDAGSEGFKVVTAAGDILEFTGAGNRMMIAPILESDQKGEEYDVAVISGMVSPQTGAEPIVKEKPDLSSLKIEVVFVIDTTQSMTEMIELTKKVVHKTSDTLNRDPELKSKVRFGLVEYQDATPGMTPSRVVTSLVDVDIFQQRLALLRAASQSSGEVKEDVLAGLVTAIDFKKMNWSEISSKHIILIGDASAHLSGPKNTTGKTLEGVVALGRKPVGGELDKLLGSITFHAVRAIQQGVDAAENEECKTQFQAVSQNNMECVGLYCELEPNNKIQLDSTADILTDFISKGVSGLASMRGNNMTQFERADKLGQQNDSVVQELYKIWKASEITRFSTVNKGKASLRAKDGRVVAIRKVLGSVSEVKRLKTTLDFVCTNLEGRTNPADRGDLSVVLQVLQQAMAEFVTGERITSKTNLQEFIAALPFKTNIMKVDTRIMASLAESEFMEWVQQLQRSADRLTDLIDSEKEIVRATPEKSVAPKYVLIRIEELP